MTRRAAYVELNFSHGEIQPTFWWVARQVGIDLDFHLLRQNLDLDPLAGLPEAPRVDAIEVADPHDPCASPLDVPELFEPGRYDLVVLGTAEPRDRPAALERLDVPQLHVHHNPPTTTDAGRTTPCVLTSRAAAWFAGPAVVIEPVYLGGPARLGGADVGARQQQGGPTAPDGPVVVCVPGNVQLHRRNYGSLLRALVQLRDAGVTPDDLVVRLLGRADAAEPHLRGRLELHGPRLRAALRHAGVTAFVELCDHELTYPELYAAASTAHYVLPLVDECWVHTRAYLQGKATGGLAVGIGSGAVPILNRRHAEVSGIDVGPRYQLDDVATGLRRALACQALDGGSRWHADRAAIAAVRDDRLARAAASFADWVERAR